MLHLRCVLVGDPCVGKTSLIVSYTRNGFCERYCPTAFDNYSVTVCVDGTPLRLELCDTAGRSEFDSIRPLSYADASVFLLCFSVAKLSSLNSATQRWLPEIRALAPTAPILLVGTQSDRRLSSQRGVLIEPGVTSQLAGHLQLNCLECSAVTQQNLKEVFDLAILHALCHQRRMVRQPDDCGVGLLLAAKERAVTCEKGVKQAKAPNGGNGLKQNFWRLVAITKKKFM